jgi:hypothetical protein
MANKNETAKQKFERLKANPSPRKFYARDLNRARRVYLQECQDKYEAMLASLSMQQLKETWLATDKMMHNEQMPMIRGWILDEFERRDLVGFEKFLESDNLDDIK